MIDVLFLVLPNTLLLDLAGPAEAFRLANQALQARGDPPAFRLRYIGAHPQAMSSIGLAVSGLEPLPTSLPARSWVVVLGRPGLAEPLPRLQRNGWMPARLWLARVVGPAIAQASTAHRLLTVCSGALLVADAGLIGTRDVTTHHELLETLAALAPAAQVRANRVFVVDGPLWSSAGITAGIDLALHCVADICGDAVAAQVAQTMVVFQRRGPDDPERSPLLAGRSHLHPAVHRVQNAVCERPADDWDVPSLAEVAHVTPRHLARLFKTHAGVSPRDYVEQVRRGLAEQALAR
ncbi:MAG TPA: AraC family transcriptional regulator, partial [Burkholderiaceae bacterium]|nr:AraC family transcriptional regulator [Burkholderiaceae bacterium]